MKNANIWLAVAASVFVVGIVVIRFILPHVPWCRKAMMKRVHESCVVLTDRCGRSDAESIFDSLAKIYRRYTFKKHEAIEWQIPMYTLREIYVSAFNSLQLRIKRASDAYNEIKDDPHFSDHQKVKAFTEIGILAISRNRLVEKAESLSDNPFKAKFFPQDLVAKAG